MPDNPWATPHASTAPPNDQIFRREKHWKIKKFSEKNMIKIFQKCVMSCLAHAAPPSLPCFPLFCGGRIGGISFSTVFKFRISQIKIILYLKSIIFTSHIISKVFLIFNSIFNICCVCR